MTGIIVLTIETYKKYLAITSYKDNDYKERAKFFDFSKFSW